jgi:hypothetical protein
MGDGHFARLRCEHLQAAAAELNQDVAVRKLSLIAKKLEHVLALPETQCGLRRQF